MNKIPPIVFLLSLAFVLFLNGTKMVGLAESSEARYSEVAREMYESNDFITPTINGVPHFTKPPLTYWITSLGYYIFGVNELGARFFISLFAVMTLLLIYITGRLEGGTEMGLTASLFLLFSPEFLVMSRVLTTDIYLTFFITALIFVFRSGEIKAKQKTFFKPILFWIIIALGFLTKGPIIFLWASLIFIPYILFSNNRRKILATLKDLTSLWGILIFLSIILPWFIIASLEHPGLLSYLTFHEATEAAYSTKRFHGGTVYTYFPILFAGFFPWSLILIMNIKRIKMKKYLFYILWLIIPFIVFSIIPSKLPTYILPLYPPLAIITAGLIRDEAKWLNIIAFAESILFILMPLKTILEGKLYFIPSVIAGLAGICTILIMKYLKKNPGRYDAIIALTLPILILSAALPFMASQNENSLKIRKSLIQEMLTKRNNNEPVLEFRTTLFSVLFYSKTYVYTYQNNFDEKKFSEGKSEYQMKERAELNEFIARNKIFWIFTDENGLTLCRKMIPGTSIISKEGKHILLLRNGK